MTHDSVSVTPDSSLNIYVTTSGKSLLITKISKDLTTRTHFYWSGDFTGSFISRQSIFIKDHPFFLLIGKYDPTDKQSTLLFQGVNS